MTFSLQRKLLGLPFKKKRWADHVAGTGTERRSGA
jgi:hypothetical protein